MPKLLQALALCLCAALAACTAPATNGDSAPQDPAAKAPPSMSGPLPANRVREELRNRVSPQAAIRVGFDKAFSAIWDSNLTTAIAGVVLWVFGTGPIRNFAIVLVLAFMLPRSRRLSGGLPFHCKYS